jgi:hypothetical protein
LIAVIAITSLAPQIRLASAQTPAGTPQDQSDLVATEPKHLSSHISTALRKQLPAFTAIVGKKAVPSLEKTSDAGKKSRQARCAVSSSARNPRQRFSRQAACNAPDSMIAKSRF